LVREVNELSLINTILQTAPLQAARGGIGFGGLIFGAVGAVAVLLVSIGIFYVLMKLAGLIDALKEKTVAESAKK
jgi:hypothetical protein